MPFEPPVAPFKASKIVGTLAKVSRHQGATKEADLLESALPNLVFDSSDNWNGGTDFFELVLVVPPEVYAGVEAELKAVEDRLHERVQPLVRGHSGYKITSVIIRPDDQLSAGSIRELDIGPKLWTDGDFRLFISHVSRYKAEAHRLKAALADFRISAFVAHDDIQPSLPWKREIERALSTMHSLLALITPDFCSSCWCDQEVGFALGSGKLVLPVRMGADPHGFMGENQGIQAKGDTYAGISKAIFKALLINDKTHPQLLDILVTRLEGAMSFSSAKHIISLIETAPSIPEPFLARLETAAVSNYEVAEAFGVPAKIKQLCSSHRSAAA